MRGYGDDYLPSEAQCQQRMAVEIRYALCNACGFECGRFPALGDASCIGTAVLVSSGLRAAFNEFAAQTSARLFTPHAEGCVSG